MAKGDLASIAFIYYSRKDVQEAIFNFCKSRETIARHEDSFSKRPDTLEYPSDILQQVKKGFSSFHCSQELWEDPLKLSTELKKEDFDNLRQGWDLLIDIDSKYLDYSKICASLLIQALEFHGIKNLGVKFSGGKGMHIIVPWKAFPNEVNNIQTKNMFPEWPRIITSYLQHLITPQLIEQITRLTTKEKYVLDEEEAKKVIPDLVLVSSRHLFRAPYSLHEKGLASVVLDKSQVSSFQPEQANPLKAYVKDFYPQARENEAKELLVSALDWFKQKEKAKPKSSKNFQQVKLDKSSIVYPPCIDLIMQGLKDGKKRAVFILINYFRSLGLDWEELEQKLESWNKLNQPELKAGYIQSQLAWNQRQKQRLPPNCSGDWYKGIAVCSPDNLCSKIKNPVNYSVIRSRKLNSQDKTNKDKKTTKKEKKA